MFLRYYAADDDGGSGAGDPPEGKIKPSDILARYGQTAESALRMAEKLAESENANWQLREKNRTLRQERDTLKDKQPGEGAVVLSADEAKDFDAYRTLGKKAGEIKAALDAATDATNKLTQYERDALLRDVQDATGFDRDVLSEIGQGWVFRIADEGSAKVVYVKDGDQETRIDQHPKVQKFMPALKKPEADLSVPPRNTSFVQQHGGQGAAGDPAAQFIQKQAEKRAAQPNPLLKGA